jgi:heme/copper-type cytochrome/quinol oxidase subunit 2
MNWINVAIIVCVIIGVCLLTYLMWFMAHPRTRKQAQEEADEWARRHSLKDRENAKRREDDEARKSG